MPKRIIIFIILIVFQTPVFSQEFETYSLQKCWQFPLLSYNAKKIASDNTTGLIVFISKENINAVNNKGELLWKTEIINENIENLVINGDRIFVYSSTDNKNFIRELGIFTGLIKQVIEVKKEENEELLELLSFDKDVFLIYSNGKVRNISNESDKVLLKENKVNLEPILKIVQIKDSEVYYLNKKNALQKVNLKSGLTKSINVKFDDTLDKFYDYSDSYLFISKNGKVYNFDSNKLKKNWVFQVGAGINSIERIGNNFIIFSNDNFVYSISGLNGNVIWKYKTLSRVVGIIDLQNVIVVNNLNESLGVFIDTLGRTKYNFNLEEGNFFLEKPLILSNQFIFLTKLGIISYSREKC